MNRHCHPELVSGSRAANEYPIYSFKFFENKEYKDYGDQSFDQIGDFLFDQIQVIGLPSNLGTFFGDDGIFVAS